MEMKKYQSITRLGHRLTLDVLKEGDHIVIQEKIDGANASFRRDGDVVRAYSRNQELSKHNTLGGFYDWVQENIKAKDLLRGVIYFGEWTNSHKVKYPEYEKQFFLYDIFLYPESEFELENWKNEKNGYYESFAAVRMEAKQLGINTVPVFYEGEYQSFEHLQSFVGRTALGGRLGDIETGEGIVVKNVKYYDRSGNQVFVKLVTDAFREVQKQKAPKDPTKAMTQEQEFVDQVVSEQRVEKFLYKFIDEGILDENYGIEDMGIILKNMNQRILEDVLKEESDMLPEEYDEKQLNKAIARVVARNVKTLINKR